MSIINMFLCEFDEKVLLKTYESRQCYKTHTPDLCFNKYQIKNGLMNLKKVEIEKLNASSIEIENLYDAVFSNHAYCENDFPCYRALKNN